MKNRDGMTLVEVLVAVTLLIIGFLGIFSSLYASGLLRETSNETNVAMFKLQTTMEYIFSLPFDDVTTRLPQGQPINISALVDSNSNNNYTLRSETITPTYTFPSPDLMQFTLAITWQSRLGSTQTELLSCARAR